MFKPDLFIDLSFLQSISYRLENFSKIGSGAFVCRCVYCGDSQTKKRKRRLYFYTKHNSLNFDCKNCGAHGSFFRFVKEQCSDVFDEYKKAQMLNRFKPNQNQTISIDNLQECVQESNNTKLDGVIPAIESSVATKYLRDRGFKKKQIDRLMFSDNFKITAQSISYKELSDDFPEDSRIVIPFYNRDGVIDLVQGRSLKNNSKMRYITIKRYENTKKVFGLNMIDNKKTIYCVEGALDSLFIDNCIATNDSNLLSAADADVYIWDNEPYNKEICKLIGCAIDKGKSVVIWNVSTDKKIDINDIIRLGITQSQLMDIIQKRTFVGLRAKAEFVQWKRC